MSGNKPRVIKDFVKLDPDIQEQIKLAYPYGFARNLISYTNKDGLRVSALPFETDEKYYLVRMTINQARQIIADDEDYGVDGVLKEDAREDYETKYADLDHMADYIADDVSDDDEDDED